MGVGTKIGSLFYELNLDDNMTGGLNNARGGVDSFSTRLSSAGKKITGLGVMMTAATAPITAGLE